MKRSLILTSTTPQGKKVQKTFTDVNENATAEAMLGATQRINLLTTNTYVQTDCVDKFNVDTEVPPVDPRQTPTITLDNPNPSAAGINTGAGENFDFTYDGDGITYVYLLNPSGTVSKNAEGVYKISKKTDDITAGTIIIVGALGTDNYKPIELRVEIQA